MPREKTVKPDATPPPAAETPGFADVCFGYEKYGFRCVRRAGEAQKALLERIAQLNRKRGKPA